MIVADTNLIAYLLLEGEFTAVAEAVYQQDSEWIAPYLWRSEFRNILALYLRKELISLDEAKAIVVQAQLILLDKEFEVESDTVLDLVVSSKLSAYDCEYVALAQALETTLVTNDCKVIQAFPETAISPQDFLAGSV